MAENFSFSKAANKTVQKVDIAIIGAGWGGLAAAKTYLQLRPEANLLIIDVENTVGGVWSKDRLYPNLVAQVRHGLFNYSDSPMPPQNGNKKDPKVTGEMIHAYLHQYAVDNDLLRRIRFNTWVTDASQLPDTRWQLTLRDSADVVEATKLILASGVTSVPDMPHIPHDAGASASVFSSTPGVAEADTPTPAYSAAARPHDIDEEKKSTRIPVIHSMDLGQHYQDLKDPAVESVVVVGAAKSAYDVVWLLLSFGKKVTWVIRPEGGGPLSILPYKLFNKVNAFACVSTRLMASFSPSILNTKGTMYRALQRTRPGRWCVSRAWDYLSHLSGVHAGYADGDHVAMLKPEIDQKSAFWVSSGLGIVTLPNFWDMLHSPNLSIVRDKVAATVSGGIRLQSGAHVGADHLILCTGWGDHFSMFNPELKARIGLPSYGPAKSDAATRMAEAGEYAKENTTTDEDDPGIDWATLETKADKTVDEKLPLLKKTPDMPHGQLLDPSAQKKWRLYRRIVPLSMAQRGDRSLAILGQIHTTHTPLVAEVQSFWAVVYLIGELELPTVDEMAEEVALWNAWTRKRYLYQGQKLPYSIYDFLSYTDTLFRDLKIKHRRKSNPISEMLSPYRPSDFNGFVNEYLARRQKR